jgi:hypothetical protein
MHAWMCRAAVALVATSLLGAYVSVPTAAAASEDECGTFESIFGACLDPGSATEATNADIYLFKTQTPCNDAILSFYADAPNKVFRWSSNVTQYSPYSDVLALYPARVRLEFKASHTDIDLHHGLPGFWMPDVTAAEGQASFDLMELQKRGATEWKWRLTDNEGDAKLGAVVWNGNERDVMASDWCDFTIDFDASVPSQSDPSKDQSTGTGAFPSAGFLTALSPCGGATVWITVTSPTEPFTYSISGPNVQVIEFLEAGSDTWKQYPSAISGALPKDKVDVNLQELLKAEDEDDWQWRITAGSAHSNACSFKVKKGISTSAGSSSSSSPSLPPPPPPSGDGPPAGFIERSSYAGNCGQRPAGTVCVSFTDGYLWLVSDSIVKQEDRGSVNGKTLRVAIGTKAEYQHLLTTNYVRQVDK